MKRYLEGILSNLFTQCAIMFSYLGTGVAGAPSPAYDKYIPYHQMPRAAVLFTLANLLINIPGTDLSGSDNFSRKWSAFGSYDPNEELYSSRRRAVTYILEEIAKYPSIGRPGNVGTYAHTFSEFVKLPWFIKPKYRDPTDRQIRFNSKRMRHGSAFRKKMRYQEQDAELEELVVMPFDPASDKSDH
jgi:hypothetical protein